MKPVSLQINEERGTMALYIAGFTIAEAWLTAEAGWIVLIAREPFRMNLTRELAITALTVVELRTAGMPETDATLIALMNELAE